MPAQLTRRRLFEGEQMRSKGRHIGWMKPDGTQVEEPDETYRNFHGALARDRLGYTGKTMDEAHKQAHLDGHVRYSRGEWLNLSFHHDRPEAHENAIKMIHKYGAAARKGINIDVEGHPSGEGSADSFMETGNADDAIDFINGLRKPQRQVTDIARARKFKFGESLADLLIRARLLEGNQRTTIGAAQLQQITKIAHQTRQERMAIDGEPELHCHLWAHHLVKNLRAAGFPAQHVAGYVHPVPNGGMPEDGEIHHWAEVGDHVVDIAADQFNYAGSAFPEVLVKHQSKVKTHVPDAVVTPSSFRMVPAPPGASDPRDSVEYDSYEHPRWRYRQWEPVR